MFDVFIAVDIHKPRQDISSGEMTDWLKFMQRCGYVICTCDRENTITGMNQAERHARYLTVKMANLFAVPPLPLPPQPSNIYYFRFRFVDRSAAMVFKLKFGGN